MSAVRLQPGSCHSLAPLDAGRTDSTVFFTSLVAGIGQRIIHPQFPSATGDGCLCQIRIWSVKADPLLGPSGDGLRHGLDETGTTIGINGMVTTVIGYHHC